MKNSSKQDPQGKSFLLTINNAAANGFTHERITQILDGMPLDYYCLADEVASTGTQHTHVFIRAKTNMRFSTIKRKFPTAHIDRARGSAAQNRDYVMKAGKWSESEKADTAIPGTFEEWGLPPAGRTKKNDDGAKITSLVDIIVDRMKNGETTLEIMRDNRMMRLGLHRVKEIWQAYMEEKHKTVYRDVVVNYFYGDTSSGKTSGIYDLHGPENVFRITHYRKGSGGVYFDGYNGEPVLVFEEFCCQIDIEDMLNYLDRYPIKLPARYADCTACYTTVYITSNIPLEQQYRDVQINKPGTWKAFLRRITNVVQFCIDGDERTHIIHKGVDVTRQHNETA